MKKVLVKKKFVRNIAQLRWEYFNEATQDYKLMVFFVPGFFEEHEGTNETDYGINDRILY